MIYKFRLSRLNIHKEQGVINEQRVGRCETLTKKDPIGIIVQVACGICYLGV